jgi:hypothetical protein
VKVMHTLCKNSGNVAALTLAFSLCSAERQTRVSEASSLLILPPTDCLAPRGPAPPPPDAQLSCIWV